MDALNPESMSIEDGLTFEDTGTFISWGTPIEALKDFEAPEVTHQPSSVHLKWKNRALFGLRCDLNATQLLDEPNPRAYHIYLPEFHYASLRVLVDWGGANHNAGFRTLFAQLADIFGDPTFSYPDYERGLPGIFWERTTTLIGYALMSGRPNLSIAHEPDGFDKLKTEAKAIREREGEGRRVDYVAW